MGGLGNRLGRTREERGDTWIFRFANGLEVHTDPFMRADERRVLPVGGPQDAILNLLVCSPERVRGKRVFDPFAGSGILGLMALRLGAAHVDFLDVNPRACQFQQANAVRNGFAAERYTVHREGIESFRPQEAYDLVLANPPFVPTPPGIRGTLTSAAGSEGNDLVEPLLHELDGLLRPGGEAFVYVMQLVTDEGPLVAQLFAKYVPERTAELTPTQAEPISLDDYCEAYRRCFADQVSAIEDWRATLDARHGPLGVQHYVMHVGPKRPGPARWSVVHDLGEKYGTDPYPAAANRELALGRVLENVVPGR